jgi:uncharacterized protein with HEPN domain
MQRDRLLLAELIDAADRVVALVEGHDADQIEADRDRRDALLWNFTVLGEASTQLSADLKAAHPEVPWADPARMRNRIVHGYWTIDFEVLVATARDDLPEFVRNARAILDAGTDEAEASSG